MQTPMPGNKLGGAVYLRPHQPHLHVSISRKDDDVHSLDVKFLRQVRLVWLCVPDQ